MSRAATDWAWGLEIKASQKLLMLSLADRADELHLSLIHISEPTRP